MLYSALPPVTLTPVARDYVNVTLVTKKLPDFYKLRVGLKGAACGGSFLIGFDTQTPDDDLYDLEGISLIIDRRHLLYLVGITIDYDPEGEGFVFVSVSEK